MAALAERLEYAVTTVDCASDRVCPVVSGDVYCVASATPAQKVVNQFCVAGSSSAGATDAEVSVVDPPLVDSSVVDSSDSELELELEAVVLAMVADAAVSLPELHPAINRPPAASTLIQAERFISSQAFPLFQRPTGTRR
ncbi:MAG: hypothetical protein ABWZ98_14055 [Nakamurella sp.]